MNHKTIGVVFVKSRDGKVRELAESISALCGGTNDPDCSIELAVSTAGPFDCILAIRGKHAESISNFVLDHLRQQRHHVVADSQTFIGWELS